ncbi:MAG TPA: hypothetical protein VMZ29_13050, partial [Candidatus Bathyarchaeia archaeon]|nr:hypothetical protein [Candidatus Bathyarchaeia archaeon]
YTYGSGYYHIYLPSGTVYINRMRTIKTGYVSYDGNIVSTLYLNAKDITLQFSGYVREDNIIEGIKTTNIVEPLISLDFTHGVSGYSDIITGTVIYVNVYDKSNNFLKCVSCNQATGYYDTGSFEAPAGNINFKITNLDGLHKTFTRTEEFLTSTTTTRDFKLQRNLGEVWVYGGMGSQDKIFDHKIFSDDVIDHELFDISFSTACPPTIVYSPTSEDYSSSWLTTSYLIVGQQYLLDKYLLRNAKISLYVQNLWLDDTDLIVVHGITNSHTEGFTAASFDWTVQASLGYAMTQTITGQLQLSGSYQEANGVTFDVGAIALENRVKEGDWTKIGWTTLDYSNNINYLEKTLYTHWQIGFNNQNYLTLKHCGSNIRYKVVYEFDLYFYQLGIWDRIGKVTYEQILGDDIESGLIYTFDFDSYYLESTYFLENPDGYIANDMNLNLLAGESVTLPIS